MAYKMTEAAREWLNRDFPFTDEAGTVWIDPSGIEDKEAHPCFICKESTNRVDINYGAHYCNSEHCEEVLGLLLMISAEGLPFEIDEAKDADFLDRDNEV